MNLKNFIFGASLLAGLPAACLAQAIACPASLAETPGVTEPGNGWTVVAGGGARPLENSGIYLGSPGQLGAQVPDATQKDKKSERVSWRLARAQGDQFWVGCSYLGTSALLVQRVAENVSQCSVSHDLLPSGRRLRVNAMVCQ